MKKQQHGLLPDHSPTVLLILDMMSDFRFPEGAQVLRAARRIAPSIAHLREKARAAGVATCYVNDNPGRWRSNLSALLDHVTSEKARGREVCSQIAPAATDYVVLKPRHSAFYATPLEALLQHLGTTRLILTGVSSHQCVLFTANDAHVRNYELLVPADCVGAASSGDTRFALRYFKSVLDADTRPSRSLRLASRGRSS
jgi:nicotinamidase-related amidase